MTPMQRRWILVRSYVSDVIVRVRVELALFLIAVAIYTIVQTYLARQQLKALENVIQEMIELKDTTSTDDATQ